MTTFTVKEIEVPLFGVVESPSKAAWLGAFAAPAQTTTIEVDDAGLDIIADELEMDAEGLVADAERYVTGKYRPKARGLGGGRLGDLGEVIAFLANRLPDREIVRVVSWRPAAGQVIKGSYFPQPDFLLKKSGPWGVLEVKTTEALDFIYLRDTPKRWTTLRPCASLAACREEALPQLGFLNGKLTAQPHSLLLSRGNIVPFPVGGGTAVCVAAVDGRLHTLQSNTKFKTPPVCRKATPARDCWSCLSKANQFVLVTMPNAPGRLSLASPPPDGADEWVRAYGRWSQALALRDLLAARTTLADVAHATTEWLSALPTADSTTLSAFWGSYLVDATRSRGFEIPVPGPLGNASLRSLNREWEDAPLGDVPAREGSLEEISGFLSQGSHPPFAVSVRLRDIDEGGTFTVRALGDVVEFRLASSFWWQATEVESADMAVRVAKRLVAVVASIQGQRWPLEDDWISLREVAARIGDTKIRLGWVSKTPRPASAPPTEADIFMWVFPHEQPPWPVLLAYGDPRVRLRVLPDGRADMRIDKRLLQGR